MTDATAQKKSILTTAMENAITKEKAKTGSDETTTPLTDEAAAKRLLKKAGLALVGTIAAVTAVIVIANRLKTEDETTEEPTAEDV